MPDNCCASLTIIAAMPYLPAVQASPDSIFTVQPYYSLGHALRAPWFALHQALRAEKEESFAATGKFEIRDSAFFHRLPNASFFGRNMHCELAQALQSSDKCHPARWMNGHQLPGI